MLEINLNFFDILGIIGSFMIAGAYFCVSNNYLKPEKFNFHFINMVGSIFILISLYFKPNIGAIFIEVLWLFIASLGIIKFFKNKNKI